MKERRQRLKRFVVILYVFILALSGCSAEKEGEVSLTEVENSEETKEKETEPEYVSEEEMQEEIYIYVCGAVRNPGVYRLKGGSRITHALAAAGGMTDKAAPEFLNQAEQLSDGQKLYVPTQEEAEEMKTPAAGVEPEESDGRININTADKSELMELSGVGEARAEAILSYREANGGFKSIDEIQNVEGIKEGIFNRIKEQIKVE